MNRASEHRAGGPKCFGMGRHNLLSQVICRKEVVTRRVEVVVVVVVVVVVIGHVKVVVVISSGHVGWQCSWL